MKKITLIALIGVLSGYAYGQPAITPQTDTIGNVTIHAVAHASLALLLPDKTIFVDPVDHVDEFNEMPAPDMILITDIHPDHLSISTLEKLHLKHTKWVVPQAVADRLPEKFQSHIVVMHNGDKKTVKNVLLQAIPMYNFPDSKQIYHPKGRGNGYILNLGGKRIYLSGDTQATPEMKSLKNIDIAFVCMNLPYTMDIHEAAEGVLAFKPKIIYPYHYKGSDVAAFKQLVESKDSSIDVRLLNWYPDN